MSNLQLTYFNARGLAETSRLILAIAGQDYDDFRYPLEVLCWKTYNFVKEEFIKDKEAGKLTNSLNKLPFLTVDNGVICQSKAVERYLARRFDMMGDDEIKAAQIDSICEWIRDYKQDYQKIRQLPEEEGERDKGMETWFSTDLPNKLQQLEPLVANVAGDISNTDQYQVTLADISLYSFICEFFDNKTGAMDATNETPTIKRIIDYVADLANVKNWISNRPDTAF